MTLIRAERLLKTNRAGEVDVPAIKGVDFTIDAKSFVAFVGPSGSGKSTLLNMIGCLDYPSGGKLTVMNADVRTLNRRAAAEFRGKLGFSTAMLALGTFRLGLGAGELQTLAFVTLVFGNQAVLYVVRASSRQGEAEGNS